MRKKTLTLSLIIFVVLVGTVYRIFFIHFVRVPSGAMTNTILPGDHIMCNKAFGDIKRGEIVIYQYPGDSTYYMKRVIGLPSERFQIRGRQVYINDQLLDERRVIAEEPDDYYQPLIELSSEGNGPYSVYYTAKNESGGDYGVATAFQIPPNSYFLMGDNRDNSEDSRYRGAAPRELIWGRASTIYWSESMRTSEPRWDRMFKRLK